MGKHVIILGAGASYTSGYPLAADLRVLLSSENALCRYLEAGLGESGICHKISDQLFKQRESTVKLFREGGFATVDEFSFLAGSRFKKEVQELKWFTSLIFASHHPEGKYRKPGVQKDEQVSAFEHSDYFPFVQRLFSKDFHELRDDVVVLTYNYDPYFEFVLERAYRTRKAASEAKGRKHSKTTLFSGLCDRNARALLDNKGFCFLKLHGTSVTPSFQRSHPNAEAPFTFQDVLENRPLLIEKLKQERHLGPRQIQTCVDLVLTPPIFFPWELITSDGKFISEEQFMALEGKTGSVDSRFYKHDEPPSSFYDVFKAIWERAQNEITEATKISFVGLSMHSFLERGLKFLFSKRVNSAFLEVEITTATPEIVKTLNFPRGGQFNSHIEKLILMLRTVCPTLRIRPGSGNKQHIGDIGCYEDFGSFIRNELEPERSN